MTGTDWGTTPETCKAYQRFKMTLYIVLISIIIIVALLVYDINIFKGNLNMATTILGIVIGCVLLAFCGARDAELNRLSQQIKELKEELNFSINNKIEESERSIIKAIEETTTEPSEEYV